MKHEFAKLVGMTIDRDCYERIEFVYMNNKHFRNIGRFDSRLLDVSYDEDRLNEAIVTIPYGDGFTIERIHKYHD